MQHDFSQLFHCETIKPLRFRVRAGANFIHDVQFLSGYLHDARLVPSAATKRGQKLSLKLERDCWEFGYTKKPDSLELHIAKSRLDIAPVSEVRWEITDPKALDKKLWIENIYAGAAHWEKTNATELVISAPHSGWKLCISLAVDYGDIRLTDLELPYLYSERKVSDSKSN